MPAPCTAWRSCSHSSTARPSIVSTQSPGRSPLAVAAESGMGSTCSRGAESSATMSASSLRSAGVVSARSSTTRASRRTRQRVVASVADENASRSPARNGLASMARTTSPRRSPSRWTSAAPLRIPATRFGSGRTPISARPSCGSGPGVTATSISRPSRSIRKTHASSASRGATTASGSPLMANRRSPVRRPAAAAGPPSATVSSTPSRS